MNDEHLALLGQLAGEGMRLFLGEPGLMAELWGPGRGDKRPDRRRYVPRDEWVPLAGLLLIEKATDARGGWRISEHGREVLAALLEGQVVTAPEDAAPPP